MLGNGRIGDLVQGSGRHIATDPCIPRRRVERREPVAEAREIVRRQFGDLALEPLKLGHTGESRAPSGAGNYCGESVIDFDIFP